MSLTDDDDLDESGIVATHGPFELRLTGVIARRDATYEEWHAATEWVQKVEKVSPFWVGDLLAYGEHKYGEMYAQVLDATPYVYGTVANHAYVAKKVECSRRRENLSFSHHQEVAPLPPAEQTEWLDTAEDEGLTVAALRLKIKAASRAALGEANEWHLTATRTCASFEDQQQLAARMRLEGWFVSVKLTSNKSPAP
jgi:hypothetical protein